MTTTKTRPRERNSRQMLRFISQLSYKEWLLIDMALLLLLLFLLLLRVLSSKRKRDSYDKAIALAISQTTCIATSIKGDVFEAQVTLRFQVPEKYRVGKPNNTSITLVFPEYHPDFNVMFGQVEGMEGITLNEPLFFTYHEKVVAKGCTGAARFLRFAPRQT